MIMMKMSYIHIRMHSLLRAITGLYSARDSDIKCTDTFTRFSLALIARYLITWNWFHQKLVEISV